MYSSTTLILKLVIYLFALAVFILCVFLLPKAILFADTGAYLPILLFMYIPALPFYVGIFNSLTLLRLIEKNKVFSNSAVSALNYIKYSGFAICVLYSGFMPYIFYVASLDDAPGVVLIAFIFIFSSLTVGTAAWVFQELLKKVVNIKSENELTV